MTSIHKEPKSLEEAEKLDKELDSLVDKYFENNPVYDLNAQEIIEEDEEVVHYNQETGNVIQAVETKAVETKMDFPEETLSIPNSNIIEESLLKQIINKRINGIKEFGSGFYKLINTYKDSLHGTELSNIKNHFEKEAREELSTLRLLLTKDNYLYNDIISDELRDSLERDLIEASTGIYQQYESLQSTQLKELDKAYSTIDELLNRVLDLELKLEEKDVQ